MNYSRKLAKQKKRRKTLENTKKGNGRADRARKKHLPDYDMKHVSLIHVCTIFSISYKHPGKHIKAQALVVTFLFQVEHRIRAG